MLAVCHTTQYGAFLVTVNSTPVVVSSFILCVLIHSSYRIIQAHTVSVTNN